MKRIKVLMTKMAILMFFLTAAVLGCRHLIFQEESKPNSDDNNYVAPKQTINNGTTIPNEKCKAIDDFGDLNSWIFFNRDYQSPNRRQFRFKYPSVLELRDADSSAVWLLKEGSYCLGIDENVYITRADDSRTPDEQFESFYFYQRKLRSDLPELNLLERIDLDADKFVYRTKSEERNVYLGVVEKHGIEIQDPRKLPEDVIYNIIRSIEFR